MQVDSYIETEFKDTQIGLIPIEWNVRLLGEISQLRLGRTPKRDDPSYWKDGSVPWVAIKDLNNGVIRTTGEKVSIEAFNKVFGNQLVPAGTLLMSFKLTIGKVGILGIDALHNEAIASFAISEMANRDYLFYLFQFIDFDRSIDNYVKGKTLNKRKLLEFPLPLPPLPEQRRIAAVLNAIQDEIAAQDDIITAARELKRSLMQHLFTYGPGSGPAETKESEIGEIPEHWALREVSQIAYKPQYGFTQSATWEDTGVKFLRITDISERGVLWSDVPYCKCPEDQVPKYALRENDIVFARTGATTGKSFLIRSCPTAVFASYLIRLRVKEGMSAAFIHCYFNTSSYWKQITMNKAGAAQPGINGTVLGNLLVPVPPTIDEQERVSTPLYDLDEKIAAEEDRKAALQDFFQSMLHQLMTGQIRLLTDEGIPGANA